MDYKAYHKLKKAIDLESSGKNLHALQIYLSITDEYPEFPDPFMKLSELYEKLGNPVAAGSILEKLLKAHPGQNEFSLYYAQFLIRNKKWDEALEALSPIPPEDEPIVSYFLGYTYFIKKDFELARLSLLNFIISDEQPELIMEAFLYLAKVEYELKNDESALKYLKKAEVIYSDYWELHFVRAKIQYRMNMYQHAVKEIEKSLKLKKKDPSVYSLAAKIYFAIKEFKIAEKYLNKYFDLCEDILSEDYSDFADVYFRLGNYKEALNYYEFALKLDPVNRSASSGKKKVTDLLNKQINI